MASRDEPATAGPDSWLEVIGGSAPLLLIAPHGGRAGVAARGILHPKVNDLQTAEITRQMAGYTGAHALINAGMDRNDIDCNRLSQIIQRAPWLLRVIADQLADIVERHGHATVLLIHGWNVIEPRIDLGLGLREAAGKLQPPPGAHVSASDAFIHGRVSSLAERLRRAEINPSFGLRYAGGGAQNLLQGFTARYALAEIAPLRNIAAMAADGLLNALQLEMSVAVRLPGALRDRAVEAITETFSTSRVSMADGRGGVGLPRIHEASGLEKLSSGSLQRPSLLPIIRRPRPPARRKVAASAAPSRVGIEFYDPVAQLGGMVSFDFGAGAAGGRIMILFERCRVALFTAEGKAERAENRIAIGPLALDAGTGGGLRFRGPAVVVNDGTAYLNVEQALSAGHLDPAMQVDATLVFDDDATQNDLFAELAQTPDGTSGRSSGPLALPALTPSEATFGRLHGSLSVNRNRYDFDATFRLGSSFTGLGPQKFASRRMIWVGIPRAGGHDAFEARALELDESGVQRTARIFRDGIWTQCKLAGIQIEPASTLRPPARIGAEAATSSGNRLTVTGEPRTFVMLSRPGPDGIRLHTLLGFAEYRLNNSQGAGLYEFSRRVGVGAL